jgi:hypothetical protein
VNDRIKHQYGKVEGIAASALTGGSLLTAADHLMLRRQCNQDTTTALQTLWKSGPTAIFTGFTPMFVRESGFITSVMYLGPFVGSKLQTFIEGKPRGDSTNTKFYDGLGRIISGIPMAALTQPFDTMARRLQKDLMQKPNEKPTVAQSLKNLKTELANGSHIDSIKELKHPLFHGAVPRMGLAATGGALAGHFYEYFKSKLAPDNTENTLAGSTKKKLG